MTYTISPNGPNISVGLKGPKKEAEAFAVLASNLFGCSYSDLLFDQVVCFKNERQFKEVLIFQKYWSNFEIGEPKNYWVEWLRAAREVNKMIWPKVKRENFLAHIWQNSGRNYYNQ
jgi:hypothetical protein